MRINWVPNKPIDQKLVEKLLQNSIKTNNFTNYGPNVQLLEKVIRNKLSISDSKAVICVNNGTTAIHAVVSGMELYYTHQLKWATQSFTFPASAQGPLRGVDILDIDTDGGIDLDAVPDNVDGIIVTNVFGNLVNIDKYTHWADTNGKLLIFDDAATSYSFYKGKNSINYGNASTVSFHHTKPIGFGEGGAIIVDKCYEFSIRRVINFGIDNSAQRPCWDPTGANYKMSDLAAVYILQYLERFEDIVAHHQMLYKYLVNKLVDMVDIALYPSYADGVPFLSCICLFSTRFDNAMIQKCNDNGIYCRKYYIPLVEAVTSTRFINTVLCLPCTVDMSTDDIDFILKIID